MIELRMRETLPTNTRGPLRRRIERKVVGKQELQGEDSLTERDAQEKTRSASDWNEQQNHKTQERFTKASENGELESGTALNVIA